MPVLSMYNISRESKSPIVGTITSNETIQKLVDVVELVELREGHVVISTQGMKLMGEYCVKEEVIHSFVWHSICLLLLIAGSSNLAKDIMHSLNVLPRVLNRCVGRIGHSHTDYIDAEHHDIEKIDGQLRKLCILLSAGKCV